MRLATLLIFAFSFSATAQTASDFTIDDIDGNTRNLFTELDNNQIVVLKFFTNWCSVCNNTASNVVAVYNDYQTNGDPVVFWALNRDQNETNAHATTYRNNHSIPFPVIGEAYSVAPQFGVQYQPEYYIIKPDRTYTMESSYNPMKNAVDDALTTLTSISENDTETKLRVTSNSVIWLAPASMRADLTVFDASGRTLIYEKVSGEQKVDFDFPAGVYIYRLTATDGTSITGKLGIAN